jgi:tetratricopeptide (TPR) repeat protein
MKSVAFAVAILLSASLPAFAQGIGEMGGVYALPKGGPGNLRNTIDNLYNQRAFTPPQPGGGGAAGGGQKSGVIGVSSPAAHMSPEQIAAYTSAAQKSYAAALAASKAGKDDIALKEYSSALAIRERVWGASDPAVADIARRQAALYSAAGKSTEAEAAWRKVLASDTRHFGPGAPELTKTISTLAALCDSQGNNREALGFYRQLFAIQQKHSPSAPDSRATRVKICELMTFTGDYAGAESLLKEGLASPDSDKKYQAQLYDCYGALLREQGRDSDATAMESKSATLRGTPPTTSP